MPEQGRGGGLELGRPAAGQGLAVQFPQFAGGFRSSVPPLRGQSYGAEQGRIRQCPAADLLFAVGVHHFPEFPCQTASGHCPEHVPARAGAQAVIQSGLHVQFAGQQSGLFLPGGQVQTPDQQTHHCRSPLFMAVMVRQFFPGSQQFSQIVAEGHPDGQAVSRHGVHDPDGMPEDGTAVPARRSRGDAGDGFQLREPRPPEVEPLQDFQKTTGVGQGQGFEQLPADPLRRDGRKGAFRDLRRQTEAIGVQLPARVTAGEAGQPEQSQGILAERIGRGRAQQCAFQILQCRGMGMQMPVGIQGQGIEMAQAIGAATVDMDQIQIHPTVEANTAALITEGLRGDGAILINEEGQRFIDEVGTRDVVSAAEIAQTGSYSWLVVDQAMADASSVIQGYIKKGYTVTGATYEELGKAMGVDAAAFAETMEKWNGYVEAKNDPDFGRTSFANPLNTAPYYAVKVTAGVHHTMGGLKINANTEVLNEKGEVIPGLFAAGEVTGGVHGANRLGGNAVADFTVFGRIAGAAASDYAA